MNHADMVMLSHHLCRYLKLIADEILCVWMCSRHGSTIENCYFDKYKFKYHPIVWDPYVLACTSIAHAININVIKNEQCDDMLLGNSRDAPTYGKVFSLVQNFRNYYKLNLFVEL